METRYLFKTVILIVASVLLFSCGSTSKPDSSELITDPAMQDSLFKNLVQLADMSIPENKLQDSLAFLILPLQASCPACRKKTIDSILKHKNDLKSDHYIVVTASGGRKIISSYFLEQDEELPTIKNSLFLDSTAKAYKFDLFKDNPVMYYSTNQKVYKKVSAQPSTIRDDLKHFFSGK